MPLPSSQNALDRSAGDDHPTLLTLYGRLLVRKTLLDCTLIHIHLLRLDGKNDSMVANLQCKKVRLVRVLQRALIT